MTRLFRCTSVILLSLFTSTGWSTPSESEGGALLVVNKGDHTLGIVDPRSGKQLAAVPENGVTGHEVIASPDGKTAYVPIYVISVFWTEPRF